MVDTSRPVLVIGATGHQGGATARELLARGREVHALVRDPEGPAAASLAAAGARLVRGDLDDPDSVRAALLDVDGVFLVLSPLSGPAITAAGLQAEQRRGRTVADLVAEVGVGHVVYSSVAGARQQSGVPQIDGKGDLEIYLRGLDLPATIVRPAFFMENFATLTRPVPVDGELVVKLPLRPDSPLQLIATRDIGAIAAIAFQRPDELIGQDLVIGGDILSGSVIAERFASAWGVPARFQQTPIAQVRAFDENVAKMFEWFDSGRGEQADLAATRVLHPGLVSFDTWLANAGQLRDSVVPGVLSAHE